MASYTAHRKLNQLCLPLLPQSIKDIVRRSPEVFNESSIYADQIRDAHGMPHNRWLISLLLNLFARVSNRPEDSNKIAFVGGWLTHYVVDAIFCGHAGFPLFQPDFDRFKRVHDMAEIQIDDKVIEPIDPGDIGIPGNCSFWDYFENAICRNMQRALEIDEIISSAHGNIEDSCFPIVKESIKDCITGVVQLFKYALILNSTEIELPMTAKMDIADMVKAKAAVIIPEENKSPYIHKAAEKIARELLRESNCQNGQAWYDSTDFAGSLINNNNSRLKSSVIIRLQKEYSRNRIYYSKEKGKDIINISARKAKDFIGVADIFLDAINARRYGMPEHKNILSQWRGQFAYKGIERIDDDDLLALAYGKWLTESQQLPMYNSSIYMPSSLADYIKFFYDSGMITWSDDAKMWFTNKQNKTYLKLALC